MKKIVTILVLSFTLFTFAQAPQGFNYQATVRNNAGVLIANQNVYFRFNILLNSQTSVPVYSETHYVPTDDLGQVNLKIGTGTPLSGTFTAINWAVGSYYLGIELNTGAGYVAMGTTQLLSVPYALYANSAGNSNTILPNGTNVGDILNNVWNGNAWVPTASIATAQLPIITTTVATNISNTSANSGGTITSDGGFSITSKGVCWSTSPNPTIIGSSTNNGTGASSFTSELSSLLPSTSYYYRAYATNSRGTGYGITYTFTNLILVAIGTQTWTNTNLDVTTYRDGTPIPQVTDASAWSGLTTGAWCYNGYATANGGIYGKLYNWYAVAGIHDNDPNTPNKILAPTGYHVPTDAEWTTLTTFLGGTAVAGGKMKSTGTSLWFSPNTDATNSSGFTGLPGGYRGYNGAFDYIGVNGGWWSSTEYVTANAWGRYLNYGNGSANRGSNDKTYGFSVRCLRD